MLVSGWILPDLYEVSCKSCSTLNGHIQIVERYLSNLKRKNIATYEKIANMLLKTRLEKPSLNLDDFAVTCLGWIKINNEPMNIVFCTENRKLDFLIQKYIDFGYSLVILERSTYFLHVCIPSKELI